jgi:hypothetical protein
MQISLPTVIGCSQRTLTRAPLRYTALCALVCWIGACSEGFPAGMSNDLLAAPPVAGHMGATAGQQVAGCASCGGRISSTAGPGGPVGAAGVPGALGNAVAGAPATASIGGNVRTAGAGAAAVSAGASGRASTGRGAAGTSRGGSSGAASAGRGEPRSSGGRGAGRGGAGAGGSAEGSGRCRASTCPDCSGLEEPCCQSNGRCGCRLLLICN